MTSEEKFLALKALDPDACIRIRGLGDWFCSIKAEIKCGSMLKSPCNSGKTTYEAIDDTWNKYTELKSGEYVVLRAYGDTRRAVKWNGFMWGDVNES